VKSKKTYKNAVSGKLSFTLSTQLVIRLGKQIRKIGFGFDLTGFGLDQVRVNSSGVTFLNRPFFPKI